MTFDLNEPSLELGAGFFVIVTKNEAVDTANRGEKVRRMRCKTMFVFVALTSAVIIGCGRGSDKWREKLPETAPVSGTVCAVHCAAGNQDGSAYSTRYV